MGQAYWETVLLGQTKKKKFKIGQYEVTGMELKLPCPLLSRGHTIIGVDPGINFGITYLDSSGIAILWGRLPRNNKLRGRDAEALAMAMTKAVTDAYWQLTFGDPPHVYIEGPAYSMSVGQPLLEQIRYGFAAGFMNNGCKVDYLPPNKARKLAFGSGKKAGKNIWVNISQNGADSIGLAIAGAVLYDQAQHQEGTS
jgi:hypothetical protein